MKRIIMIFFLLSGCNYTDKIQKTINSNISFSDDLTSEEFRIKLNDYADNSPYPNIDD
jgi:hypothetical protein